MKKRRKGGKKKKGENLKFSRPIEAFYKFFLGKRKLPGLESAGVIPAETFFLKPHKNVKKEKFCH